MNGIFTQKLGIPVFTLGIVGFFMDEHDLFVFVFILVGLDAFFYPVTKMLLNSTASKGFLVYVFKLF